MKHIIKTSLLTSLFLVGCNYKQAKNKTMEIFEYSLENAHPNAQAVMKDEFYWSPIEETAPFGSDDGSDAAYGFKEWRLTNKATSPVKYLDELIARWQYPYFDYNEMDTTKIKEFLTKKKELSETEIEKQIAMLKEINKNSPDSSMMNLDDRQLRELIISTMSGMNDVYLLGQDNAIIATGFAQFVLEGRMDSDIKRLSSTAIKRQLLPLFIDRYGENYRDRRKQQLTKMLEVVNNAGS